MLSDSHGWAFLTLTVSVYIRGRVPDIYIWMCMLMNQTINHIMATETDKYDWEQNVMHETTLSAWECLPRF